MKYRIVEKDGRHIVEEVATKQVIRNYLRKEHAERLSKFLSSGGGFNGWTPRFILE